MEPVIHQKPTHGSEPLEPLLTELVEPLIEPVTTKKKNNKKKKNTNLAHPKTTA